jgi:hypothetical protein
LVQRNKYCEGNRCLYYFLGSTLSWGGIEREGGGRKNTRKKIIKKPADREIREGMKAVTEPRVTCWH